MTFPPTLNQHITAYKGHPQGRLLKKSHKPHKTLLTHKAYHPINPSPHKPTKLITLNSP